MAKQKVSSARQRRNADTMAARQSAGKAIAKKAAAPVQSARALAELTTKARKALPKSTFAVPSKRSKSGGSGGYPIPDEAHARNALARVSQFGTPAEQAQVRAAVARKFPNIGKKAAPKKGGK